MHSVLGRRFAMAMKRLGVGRARGQPLCLRAAACAPSPLAGLLWLVRVMGGLACGSSALGGCPSAVRAILHVG